MSPTLSCGEDIPDEETEEPPQNSISEPPWQLMDEDDEMDEEENTASMYGYQILPTSSDLAIPSLSEENVDLSIDANTTANEVQPRTALKFEIAAVHTPNMGFAQAEKIKSVMKNITLPSSNFPEWSTVVPEKEWKSALLKNLFKPKSVAQQTPTASSTNDDSVPGPSRTNTYLVGEDEDSSSSSE